MPLSQMFIFCNIFKVGDIITDIIQSESKKHCYILTDGSPKVITLDTESKMNKLRSIEIFGFSNGIS